MGESVTSVSMRAFTYPAGAHIRKHGPRGYDDYESYRDWLRDEFLFRCVMCLDREQWIGRTGKFHVDHIRPESLLPQGRLDYDNLMYLCSKCNLIKSNKIISDPCSVSLRECLAVQDDGTVVALNKDGQRLVDVFRLDTEEYTRHRGKWIRLFKRLESLGDSLKDWLGFPDDLPDLRARHVPANDRPSGVNDCCYALRERGELPELY